MSNYRNLLRSLNASASRGSELVGNNGKNSLQYTKVVDVHIQEGIIALIGERDIATVKRYDHKLQKINEALNSRGNYIAIGVPVDDLIITLEKES